ncbi:MAG: LamG domain-containing protein [Anaeromyxobacter sp.]
MTRLTPVLLALASLLASPASAQQRPAPEPSRGLLAWYPLAGTAVDALSGAPARGVGLRAVEGPQGQGSGALWFDGVRSFADLGDRLQPGRFTVSAWIRPERVETPQVVVSKIRNLPGHYQRNLELRVEPGGRLFLQAPGGAAWDGVTGQRAVSPGRWTHVAATYDGARAQLWVDGEPDGPPLEVAYAQTRTPIFVGARPESGGRDGRTVAGPAFFFQGAIADVRLWDRALGAPELREAAGRSAPRPPVPEPGPAQGLAQPVARLPLDGDARDATGQADGRVVGPLRVAEDRQGNPGGALAFPGRDGWVDLGVRVEPERLSISAWVRLSRLDDDQVIFSKWSSPPGSSGDRWLELRVDRGGRVVFALPSGTLSRAQQVRSGRPIAQGRWTHLAAVYDGAQATLYVNGAIEGQARLEPFEAARGPAFLGGRPDQRGQGVRPWTSLTGRLDEVLLFRGALRPQDVAALASGAPFPPPAPPPGPGQDDDVAAFLLTVDRFVARYDQAVIQRKAGEVQELEGRILKALEEAERDARADRNLRVAGYVRRAAADLREAKGELDAMSLDRKRSALHGLSEALWNDLVEDVDGLPFEDPRVHGRSRGRWY